MTSRPLLLRFALLNAVVVTLAAAGLAGFAVSRLQGAALVSVPAILLLYTCAAVYVGWLAWQLESPPDPTWPLRTVNRVQHNLRHVSWVTGNLPFLGMLGTLAGLMQLAAAGDISTRLQHGLMTALMSAFAGISTSLALMLQEHLLEHKLPSGR